MDPEKWSRFDENASKEQVMDILAAVVSDCDEGLNGRKIEFIFYWHRLGVYIEGRKQNRCSVYQSDQFASGKAD